MVKSPFPYLVMLLFAVAFYLFSTRAHFLGDGYQLLAQLSDPTLALKSESYGDMKVHQLLAQFINAPDQQESIYLSFKYTSIFSGIIFILTLLYYGRKITATPFAYYAFVLMNLCGASVILYFGYVETYGLVTAFLSLFFISALAALINGRRSIIPILAFAIAVFFHKIALIFLPAFLIYLVMIFLNEKMLQYSASKKMGILAIITGMVFIFYLIVKLTAPLEIRNIFLSPIGDRFTVDGYFLLSWRHLLDYLNLVLFLAPIFIVLILIGLRHFRKLDSSGVNQASLFILISVVIGGLAAFIIEPKLGMARDWDLFSTMLIPAQLAGVYLWVVWYQSNKHFQSATFLLVVLSLSIMIPWLALNNSPDGLRRYAIDIMKQDPKHGRSGLFTIIPMLEKQGMGSDAEQLKKFCNANYPEMEMVRHGEGFLLNGNYNAAEKLIEQAIMENPSFFRGYQLMARIQLARDQYLPALENFKIADALNPYNSENSYFMASIYLRMGQNNRALELWRRSIRYDAINPFPYRDIAAYFYEKREIDSALHYFSLIPDTAEVYPFRLYYDFGLDGLKYGDTLKAIYYFDRYLKVGDDSTLMGEVRKIRDYLQSHK
ncbi:MAG: hypothetical protein AB1746_14195 [Candidatus Zixiibacteriota bacterium]